MIFFNVGSLAAVLDHLQNTYYVLKKPGINQDFLN